MRLLVLSLALSSTFSFAQDACPLDFSRVHSVLRVAPGQIMLHGPEERDNQRLVVRQSGTLASGDKVTYSVGGCRYFGYSLTYERFGLKNGDRNEVIGRALRLLKATPVADTIATKVFLDSIRRVKPVYGQPDHYEVPCPNGTCTIDASAVGKIVLTYDRAPATP